MMQHSSPVSLQTLSAGASPYGDASQSREFYTSGESASRNMDMEDGKPLYPKDPQTHSTFRVKGFQDWWAAVLFVFHLLVVAGLAVYNFSTERSMLQDKEDIDVETNFLGKVLAAVAASFVVGLFIALVSLILMRVCPKPFIIISKVAMGLISIGLGAFLISRKSYFGGIIAILMGLFAFLVLFLLRRFIPFAAVLLKYAARKVMDHWGTMVVSFFGLLAIVLYVFMWIAMLWPYAKKLVSENPKYEAGPIVASLVGLLFLFWAMQVIINVVHVTASGSIATWYFLGRNVPKQPTLGSLRRATTTSFGSICFGSMIVAVVKLIKYIVDMATRTAHWAVRCIAMCIMGCIDWLVQYFNVYAFTHVAIYGSSYLQAAKQTFQFIRNCGCRALWNDSLVWSVLGLTTLVAGLVCGVAGGLITKSWVIGFLCFAAAAASTEVILRPVYSAVVTMFVCVAEVPEALGVNPQFKEELQAAGHRCTGQQIV